MKIGIFGGSFNPPHKSHINIAKKIIDKKYVDKVIFVPTASNYEKEDLININHRINMLNLSIKNKNLEVSNISDNGYFYTYQVLDYFKKKYPSDEIYFITGTDNLSYFKSWKRYKYILNNYYILAINRGNDIDKLLKDFNLYKDKIIITNIKVSIMSSTLIRSLVNNNKSILKYVDRKVNNYIKLNKLYIKKGDYIEKKNKKNNQDIN